MSRTLQQLRAWATGAAVYDSNRRLVGRFPATVSGKEKVAAPVAPVAPTAAVTENNEPPAPKAPARRAPRATKMTPERIALATRLWRDEYATLEATLGAVNALPGPAIASIGAMEMQLSAHGIHRGPKPARAPDAAWSERALAASSPETPRAVTPTPASPRADLRRAPDTPKPARLPPLPKSPGEVPVPPRLPDPGADGKIAATFFQIRTWAAARLHLAYDGTNIGAVNRAARAMFRLPEIVQLGDDSA